MKNLCVALVVLVLAALIAYPVLNEIGTPENTQHPIRVCHSYNTNLNY